MISKFLIIFLLITTSSAWATKDDHDGHLKVHSGKKSIRFSGYIDGYYAHDFSNPIDVAMILKRAGKRAVKWEHAQVKMVGDSTRLTLFMIANSQ